MNLKPNKNFVKTTLFFILTVIIYNISGHQVKALPTDHTWQCTLSNKGYLGDIKSGEFGDDINEPTQTNLKVSCAYKPSTAIYKPTWSNFTYIFVAEGKRNLNNAPNGATYRKLETGSEYFLECKKPITFVNDAQLTNELYNIEEEVPWWIDLLSPDIISITYSIQDSFLSRYECSKCPEGNVSKCPNWINKPTTQCVIFPLSTSGGKLMECKFGSSAGQTCADPASQYVNKVKEGNYTYFCGSAGGGRLVQCDGDQLGKSYSDIFQSGTNYQQLRDTNVCRFYDSIGRNQPCKMNSTDRSSLSCTFGPLTTNTGTRNCAEDTAEGTYTDGTGTNIKYNYCSPDGRKVECSLQYSYSEIFLPSSTFDPDYTVISDYTGKNAIKKSNCSYKTNVEINLGCDVTPASLDKSDCKVPQYCFDTNKVVETNRIGVGQGHLFCISKRDKPQEGTVYFCPHFISTGWPSYTTKYNYRDVAEAVPTGVSGEFSINLKANSLSTCKPVSLITVNLRTLNPLSPINLIKNISTTLYYFAIFYFIVLILINAFSYIRSGEDPSKLKQINESLFNTIAGFIFVLASGGVILYIINSFQ